MPDQQFNDFIEANLGKSAQVQRYIEIARQIEQEAAAQNQAITHRHSDVSVVINDTSHKAKGFGDSAFTSLSDENPGSFDGSQYDSGDMVTGDQAAVDAGLAQVDELSDVIVITFGQHHDVLNFIEQQLVRHSPFKTGRYQHNHVVFADGELIEDMRQLVLGVKYQVATEFIFVDRVPYSTKIEEGESSMAPSGVYELVAKLAEDRYGGTVKIHFIDYVGTFGTMVDSPTQSYSRRTRRHFNRSNNRYPAISVTIPNK